MYSSRTDWKRLANLGKEARTSGNVLVDNDVVQYLVAGEDMIIMGKPEKVSLLTAHDPALCARARYRPTMCLSKEEHTGGNILKWKQKYRGPPNPKPHRMIFLEIRLLTFD